jgi:pimeloyl-ACP methyl ester carboxylesterase
MKNVSRWWWIAAAAGLLVGLAIYANWSYTPPMVDAQGEVLSGSVAVLEKIGLGGVPQYILIRGKSRAKPVLLFLHGGPGMPAMYLAHAFQRPLEEDFVVVQWDRRGAGKSYNRHISPESISVEQEIADTLELTDLLARRFHQDRIFLVGHSYGSYLGMLVVQRSPEKFHAYVGIGQLACSKERMRQIQDRWIRQEAESRGNREALEELNSGKPLDREKWLFEFGGERRNATNWLPFLWIGLRAPEYSLVDAMYLKAGVNFTARNMKYNAIAGDLMDGVKEVKRPVFFFTGRHDYTDPFECTSEYFRQLRAPMKEMVWFGNSAHFPFLEEPEKFAEEMKKVVRVTMK